jgi:hypothetical protein
VSCVLSPQLTIIGKNILIIFFKKIYSMNNNKSFNEITHTVHDIIT